MADSLISSLVVRRKSLQNSFLRLPYNVFSVSLEGAFYRIKTLIFFVHFAIPVVNRVRHFLGGKMKEVKENRIE